MCYRDGHGEKLHTPAAVSSSKSNDEGRLRLAGLSLGESSPPSPFRTCASAGATRGFVPGAPAWFWAWFTGGISAVVVRPYSRGLIGKSRGTTCRVCRDAVGGLGCWEKKSAKSVRGGVARPLDSECSAGPRAA